MPDSSTLRVIYIYVLRQPSDGAVRYVGQSHDPKRRFAGHLWQGRSGQRTYHARWIRKILATGDLPILEIIEEATVENWQVREPHWIAWYRAQGCRLVNTTDGGDGTLGWVPPPEWRAHHSEAIRSHKPPAEDLADACDLTAYDYVLLSPDGEEVAVRNLSAFCAKRGFSQSLFGSMLRGERQHAYKWRIRRISDPPFEPLAGALNAYRRGGIDFELRSFAGEIVTVHNLSEFCRERGLSEKSLRFAVDRPDRTSQGWQIRRQDGPPFAPRSRFHRIQKRREAEYIVTSPIGEVIRVRSIRRFCLERDLKEWWFHDILRGRRDNYEGWKIRHPGDA